MKAGRTRLNYKASDLTPPKNGGSRVLRGGAWNNDNSNKATGATHAPKRKKATRFQAAFDIDHSYSENLLDRPFGLACLRVLAGSGHCLDHQLGDLQPEFPDGVVGVLLAGVIHPGTVRVGHVSGGRVPRDIQGFLWTGACHIDPQFTLVALTASRADT
jgi:hypothetical protein